MAGQPQASPDANYQALQQNLMGIHAPRVGLQESIIDAIPLAVSAFADDNGQTSAIVSSILNRKKQQDQLQFENELELRKLQLDTAFKGIQNEREKVDSLARNAYYGAETAGLRQRTQQDAQKFPVELQNLQLVGDKARQEIDQSKELFPLQKEEQQARTLNEKSFARQRDAEAQVYENRINTIGKYQQSPNETDRRIGDMIAMTGQIPDLRKSEPEDLLKLGASADPYIATNIDAIRKGDAPPEVQQQVQTRLENLTNPKTQPIAPMINDVVGDYYSLLKTDYTNSKNIPQDGKLKGSSQQLVDSAIKHIAPRYNDLTKAGFGDALDSEIVDIANHLSPKLGITGPKLKNLIKKTADQLETADGQKKFIEDQLGTVINPDDELKQLQAKLDEQQRAADEKQKEGEKKQKELEQQKALEQLKLELKSKLMYPNSYNSDGSYKSTLEK